ncbi:MAG: XkdF-like putative serine protease domain-containing protein [Oscillospiraceae bacterium]|nr:XkdF-like putative serine protease domain-containing protein [Oscillospiraceae bacterium]
MKAHIRKAIEISDAKIQFVSLVDSAANKRQFLVQKAEDGKAQFSSVGKILMSDDTTHFITGIVYAPLTEDTHGNFMTEEEIKKAAHWFAKNGDKVDLQHSFEQVAGVTVVETYVAPCDMEIGGQSVVKGSWLMTVEVDNTEVWAKVQKGEITGFSMGGVGTYSEAETQLPETAGVFQELSGGGAGALPHGRR